MVVKETTEQGEPCEKTKLEMGHGGTPACRRRGGTSGKVEMPQPESCEGGWKRHSLKRQRRGIFEKERMATVSVKSAVGTGVIYTQ